MIFTNGMLHDIFCEFLKGLNLRNEKKNPMKESTATNNWSTSMPPIGNIIYRKHWSVLQEVWPYILDNFTHFYCKMSSSQPLKTNVFFGSKSSSLVRSFPGEFRSFQIFSNPYLLFCSQSTNRLNDQTINSNMF